MDFLQVKTRARATNTLVDTFQFTEMEIREGIKKLYPFVPIVFKTAEGYSKTYPLNQQTRISFDAFLELPVTVQKLAKLQVFMAAGYVFDLEILQGLQFYSQPLDALIRDPTESVMTYFELTDFDRDYRTINHAGLTWRDKCKVEFSAGVRPAVYSQANFIASAPPIGGLGN